MLGVPIAAMRVQNCTAMRHASWLEDAVSEMLDVVADLVDALWQPVLLAAILLTLALLLVRFAIGAG